MSGACDDSKGLSEWMAVHRFAMTLNGYERFGEALPDLTLRVRDASDLKPFTTEELRGALFFECRSYRHFGWPPEGVERARLLDVATEIRRRIATGQENVPNE